MSDLLKADDKMKTPELLGKLHDYYTAKRGAWAFLSQVRSTTGYATQIRTADAMAMGLWPSSGLDLVGFELKVSRSDWLHEIKKPEKHQEMKQFCDKWYLVVPTMDIVKDGELPKDWGLMVACGRGRTIKVKVEAPELNPVDIDRPMLASIFRNVTEKTIPLEMAMNQQSSVLEQQKKWWENEHKAEQEEAAAIKQKIKDFEAATGIDFTTWKRDHMELAKVVKAALDGRYDKTVEKMQELRITSEKITKFIDGEIQQYEI